MKKVSAAYYAVRCCIAGCLGTALFRAGRDGYCRQHRGEAVKRLQVYRAKWLEPQRTGAEQERTIRDHQTLGRESLRQAKRRS